MSTLEDILADADRVFFEGQEITTIVRGGVGAIWGEEQAGPVNTVAPEITGTAEVGQTLSCSTGTWDGTGTITYAYQWRRGAVPISGATGASYVQQTADVGPGVTCLVTATDDEGSRSAVSNAVATEYPQPVAAGELADIEVDQGSGDWTRAAGPDFTGLHLTFSLFAAPAGTSINPATGLVTGTSANLLSGASVVVRASTPDGKTADSGFSVTVSAPSGVVVDATEDVLSLWLGAVTTDSITATARTDDLAGTTRLVASTSSEFTSPIYSPPLTPDADYYFAKGTISGLAPDTEYHIGVEVDGVVDGTRLGTFRTSPESSEFMVGFASCARTGSNELIFDTIAANDDLLLFLHLGDLHYEDIGTNNVALFHGAYDSVFAAARQNALWRNLPMFYMWDDHDYGPNNSGASATGREAAIAAYRARVPTPTLPRTGATTDVGYSFKIGRVRFVMLDTRSQRVTNDLIGSAQEAWLIDLMENAPADEVMVINASVPWVSASGADTWHDASAQRTRISDAITDFMPGRVAVIAGDMHMMAYDDGTNTLAGEPVFHAAPLDQSNNSVKGGPYSSGTPVSVSQSQYGTLQFEETDGWIDVTFRGYSVNRSNGARTQQLTYTARLAPPPSEWDITGGNLQLTINSAPAAPVPAVPQATGGNLQLTITE